VSLVGSEITCARVGCKNVFAKDCAAHKYCVKHQPSAECQHEKRRNQCRECGTCAGSEICEHGIRQYVCRQCSGAGLCEHGRRSQCWLCDPLGWASHCINRAKSDAKSRKHLAPKIAAEELVELRRRSDVCCFCEQALSWADSKNSPHLHHDHETGEVFGYAHPVCNKFEGQVMSLGVQAAIVFLENMLRTLKHRSPTNELKAA
jgi:hypothetical protein